MSIDGIRSSYGVPRIKEERGPEMNKKKKEDKQDKEKKRKDEKKEIIKDGKVDIRI